MSIRRRPFEVAAGDDPAGTYLLATVDVDETERVMDAYMDYLLTVQIDEGLSLYVLPLHPHAPVTKS